MQPLLTQRQCAEALALSERTLERFRVSGVDPKFVRMGKSIRYRLSDVDAWIASRVVGSTAEDINVRCNARNVEKDFRPARWWQEFCQPKCRNTWPLLPRGRGLVFSKLSKFWIRTNPRDGHSDELDRRMKGEGADHVRICRIG